MKEQSDATLFCAVGECVEFMRTVKTRSPDADEVEVVEKGAVYKAVRLTGYGWDLELFRGIGPKYVRILNSQMPEYVRLWNAT